MTEESRAAMTQALDAVKLDADMRAMAENAMQHFASVTAEPSAAQIVAESQAEHDVTGGGGGMDAPAGMTVAPMTPEPYHPVSLFRLKFSFGSDGSYSGVTMEEPKFLWNEADEDGNPSTSLKTAGVGTIGLNGTIYLNITLSGEDGAKKFASAQVSMSSDGDISVPLYQLDPTKGVTKDYRHAMISLGVCTPGGQEPDDFSIDKNGGEDENKLQIAHFNDDEKDSGKGLATRLKADTETGAITSDDNELMLLARKNGELIYVPLSGNGQDPPSDDPSAPDPCDHDSGGGSKGGVTPDDGGGGHGGGGGGVGSDFMGGVFAGGEPHTGDDNCNCE